MALPVLLEDALTTDGSGFLLRVSLPWIRSMPLAGVTDLAVTVDGDPVTVSAIIDGRLVPPAALVEESAWWFVQDRLTLRGELSLEDGPHDIRVSFVLLVPYLQAGPDGPLALPFDTARTLAVGDGRRSPALLAQTSPRPASPPHHGARGAWILSASAFNWTPEVIRAERTATDIAVGIVEDAVAETIEIEAGQLWRSFPAPSEVDVDAFRERLAAAGGAVTIVGASLDDWALPPRRRTVEERLAFLAPQLRAAARLGARGVRVPFGQAGPALLALVQPVLDELDIVLFEEIQGQQTLDSPAVAENLELLQALEDPRIRVLVDISMLMPALPPSYLDELRRGGVDEGLVARLEQEWRAPATHQAVVATLRAGAIPPPVRTLFMNMLVRFGRSTVADIAPLLPMTSGVHLKFWDLDDTAGRVSRPIADIGEALRRAGFTGTFTSEWGGHEWLAEDATDMTRRHLELARRALSPAGVLD